MDNELDISKIAQLNSRSGLTVDYRNVFFGINLTLNDFIIRHATLSEEQRIEIVNQCKKIKSYSERYGSNADFVNAKNRQLITEIDAIVEQIRNKYGSLSASDMTDERLKELNQLIELVYNLISPS
jgi:hypothetical protein